MKKACSMILLAGSVLFISLPLWAQDEIEPVQTIKYPHGMPSGITVKDGFAYVVNGWSRGSAVLVFDIRKAEQPIYSEGVAIAGYPKDLLIQGDFAYLPSGFGVIVLKGMKNGKPQFLRNMLLDFSSQNTTAQRAAIAGGILWIGGKHNWRAMDISSPTEPVPVLDKTGLDPAENLVGDGDMLYSWKGKEIKIYQVKNGLPLTVGKFEAKAPVGQLLVSDKTLFANTNNKEFSSYDISDLSTVQVKASLKGVISARFSQGKLVLLLEKSRIALIEDNLSELKVAKEFELPECPPFRAFDLWGNTFCAISGSDLMIFNLGETPLRQVASIPILNNEGFIAVLGNILYASVISGKNIHLLAFDSSRPRKDSCYDAVISYPSPEKTFIYYNITMSTQVKQIGQYLIAGGGLIDIKNPLKPEFVRTIGAPASAIKVEAQKAFMAQGSKLTIEDVSKLPESTTLGVYKPEDKDKKTLIIDVETDGQFAYIINGSKIEVLVVRNPGKIEIAAQMELFRACGLLRLGKYLYVPAAAASPEKTLAVIDVSNPSKPVLVKKLDGIISEGSNTIISHNGKIFLTDGNIIKELDPAKPLDLKLKAIYSGAALGSPEAIGGYTSIFAEGDKLYGKRYSRIDTWKIKE
ncbi:MAG: hypothetical protein A2X49_14255 [Lentisphaerae bacterium GWF2_52_8]|nr:MAG: hypothetical protein A2X49_14255 [Lentisphaerae bacterium GWF2_52_8]